MDSLWDLKSLLILLWYPSSLHTVPKYKNTLQNQVQSKVRPSPTFDGYIRVARLIVALLVIYNFQKCDLYYYDCCVYWIPSKCRFLLVARTKEKCVSLYHFIFELTHKSIFMARCISLIMCILMHAYGNIIGKNRLTYHKPFFLLKMFNLEIISFLYYSSTFQCNYIMTMNPFDIQRCTIGFSLVENQQFSARYASSISKKTCICGSIHKYIYWVNKIKIIHPIFLDWFQSTLQILCLISFINMKSTGSKNSYIYFTNMQKHFYFYFYFYFFYVKKQKKRKSTLPLTFPVAVQVCM